MNDKTQPLRDRLVRQLRTSGALRSKPVIEAFRRVPRHLFVPDEPLEEVYSDRHFVTKAVHGVSVSSASQPSVMATMLEQLQVRPGQRVMEIGAGTGYNAALLSELVGESGGVFTVDILADVAEEARRNLASAGYAGVEVIAGDGGYGHPPGAPYDRIIATAGCWQIPSPWLEQLAEGGVLVLPLRLNLDTACVAFQKRRERLTSLSCGTASFIPLIGAFGRLPGRALVEDRDAWLLWDYEGDKLDAADLDRLLEDEPRQETPAGAEHLITFEGRLDLAGFVALHGEALVMLTPRDSQRWAETKWGLADTGTPSACLVALGSTGAPICELYGESGSFQALQSYLERWVAAGRPGKSRLRLQATPAGDAADLSPLPQRRRDGTFRFVRGDLAFTARYQK